jgi:UDP-N-acetylglucosamine 2-epimerase (non-hydrolysing)
MAASLGAHYGRRRVGHVEAGLRTYDRDNPFPEEMNRVVTDHICDLHFAPTEKAKQNLLHEGIDARSVVVTGNTVVDALLEIAARPTPAEILSLKLPTDKDLVLVTAHRRENHGRPLQDICKALRELSERKSIHIIYPVHRNPKVWQPVHALLGDLESVSLVPPQDYQTMVHLIKGSRLILTDSGGLQEEAPSLGVPVLVLRKTTERPEAIEAGTARLVGTNTSTIVNTAIELLEDKRGYERMSTSQNPFGDGQAAQRIVDALLRFSSLT